MPLAIVTQVALCGTVVSTEFLNKPSRWSRKNKSMWLESETLGGMGNATFILWASVSLAENEEVKLDPFHKPLSYKIRNCILKELLRWFLCTLMFAKLQSRGFLVICLIQISDSMTTRTSAVKSYKQSSQQSEYLSKLESAESFLFS